ncbi:MAG: MmcQ/YjbR family DNA-binding protein [Erysipelotrichaceae bacterium]|nr:MmcQ/YjbR family DNA-binding protein [Erysipelotrichaceae bacterium]
MRTIHRTDGWNIDESALESFGFVKKDTLYVYEKQLLDNTLNVVVEYTDHTFQVGVYDVELEEEYLPYYVTGSTGEYVGKVKELVEDLLESVKRYCATVSPLAETFARNIQQLFGVQGKHPFSDGEGAMAFYHPVTDKWFALMMKVPYRKFGIDQEGTVDAVNIKLSAESIEKHTDYKLVFPAYHMNKKYWVSLVLSSYMDEELVYRLVKESYNLVSPKRK